MLKGAACSSDDKLYVTGGTASSTDYITLYNWASFPLENLTGAYFSSNVALNGDVGTISRFDITPMISATGIEKNDNGLVNNSTLIYPNPSNGQFTISTNLIKNSTVKITIYDILGQIIEAETYKNQIGSFSKNYNVNFVSDGIYLVVLSINDEIISKKLIKQQ